MKPVCETSDNFKLTRGHDVKYYYMCIISRIKFKLAYFLSNMFFRCEKTIRAHPPMHYFYYIANYVFNKKIYFFRSEKIICVYTTRIVFITSLNYS